MERNSFFLVFSVPFFSRLGPANGDRGGSGVQVGIYVARGKHVNFLYFMSVETDTSM